VVGGYATGQTGKTLHWNAQSWVTVSLRIWVLSIIIAVLVGGGGAAGWVYQDEIREITGFKEEVTHDPILEENNTTLDENVTQNETEGPAVQNWSLVGHLRPGSRVDGPGGTCTLNFLYVFADGNLAIGAAGHCFNVGDEVSNPDIDAVFGEVVYSVDDRARGLDFCLINITHLYYSEANPQMREYGGPTGISNYENTEGGAVVDLYGHAAGAGANEETRSRQGVLVDDNEKEYQADVPAWWGDSGGPVIMDGNGQALGINSRISPNPGNYLVGSTVAWILINLEADGFPVTMVTAPRL